MSEREFTPFEEMRLKDMDEKRQWEFEMDRGHTASTRWTRICTGCHDSYAVNEPTKRVFDKMLYQGKDVLVPRMSIPRPHKCPKCRNGSSVPGLEE